MPTLRWPASIQVHRCWLTCRSPSSRPSAATNIASEIANEPSGSRVPSRCPHLSVYLPPTSRIAAPAAGSAITSQSREKTPSAVVGSTTGMDSPACSANIEVLS